MSSERPTERNSVTSGEDGPQLFDFGPDLGRPESGPAAALPPWMVEQQRAAAQQAAHEADLPHAGQTIGIRLARQAALVTVGAPAPELADAAGDPHEADPADVTPEPVAVPEFARVVPAPRRRRKPVPADRVVIAAPAVVDGEDVPVAALADADTNAAADTGDGAAAPAVPAPGAEASPALAVLPLAESPAVPADPTTPVLAKRRRRRWVHLAQVAGIVAIGASVGIYAAGGVGFLQNRTKADPPTAEATAWVLNNLAGAGTVLVPSSLTDALVQNGEDSAAVNTYRDGSDVALAKGCCDYLVLIGTPNQVPGTKLPAAVHTLFERSRPAAVFTTGGGWTQVRQVLPGTPAQVAKDLAADHAALVATGKSLIASRRVSLSAVAKQQVQDGQVDARVLIGIVAVALQHKITVASFPAQPGETDPGILRRSVAISQIDGKAVKDVSDRVTAVKGLLAGQAGIYKPSGAEVHPVDGVAALEFRYDAPSPFGVLTLNNGDGKRTS